MELMKNTGSYKLQGAGYKLQVARCRLQGAGVPETCNLKPVIKSQTHQAV